MEGSGYSVPSSDSPSDIEEEPVFSGPQEAVWGLGGNSGLPVHRRWGLRGKSGWLRRGGCGRGGLGSHDPSTHHGQGTSSLGSGDVTVSKVTTGRQQVQQACPKEAHLSIFYLFVPPGKRWLRPCHSKASGGSPYTERY